MTSEIDMEGEVKILNPEEVPAEVINSLPPDELEHFRLYGRLKKRHLPGRGGTGRV